MVKHLMTSLLLLLATSLNCVLSKNLELLILHNNDIHGRFEETTVRSEMCEKSNRENNECIGGLARTAHVIRQARKDAEDGKGPKVLYLNAGDTYTGTAWFYVHKWKIAVEMLNFLQPNATSFGNHEFDDGLPGLIPFLNAATFPILAANINFSNTQLANITKLTKSVVLEVDGHRIGIIGYLTSVTAFNSQHTNITWNQEIDCIKAESEKLNLQGAKTIIALGHSGINVDKIIAREVPLVDIVVGGHSHTFLWSGPQPSTEKPQGAYPFVIEQSSGKRVPVVQAYAFAKYLGRLYVTLDENGRVITFNGQPMLLDNSVPQDPGVLNVLNKYRPEVDASNAEVVGTSKVVLNGSCMGCRTKECNLGSLVADAFVAYYVSMNGEKYVPLGFVNAGAIRHTIQPNSESGSITRTQITTALPYVDTIVALSLTGADLLNTLEIGARYNGSSNAGELLQVSGIRYTVDFMKPSRKRLVEAKVRCSECRVPSYEPIDPQKTYRIVTNGFLSKGGDGHSVIQNNGFNKVNQNVAVLDIVLWYLGKTPLIDIAEEGRLTVKGTLPGDC